VIKIPGRNNYGRNMQPPGDIASRFRSTAKVLCHSECGRESGRGATCTCTPSCSRSFANAEDVIGIADR